MSDEILEEVYAARRKIAEECDYDFDKLLARYERMQAENPEGLCYEIPKSEAEPTGAERSPAGGSAPDPVRRTPRARGAGMVDEIVEEVHAARRQIWEECGRDFQKLCERLMRLQEEHPENLVYEVPKTEPEPTAAE